MIPPQKKKEKDSQDDPAPSEEMSSPRFQSNFPQTPVDMIYPQTFAIWNSS